MTAVEQSLVGQMVRAVADPFASQQIAQGAGVARSN